MFASVFAFLALSLTTISGASLPDVPRGYVCAVAWESALQEHVIHRSGKYPGGLDVANLTTMMGSLHAKLRKAYPDPLADDIRVSCRYRNEQGNGIRTIVFFIGEQGQPYGEHIP